MLAFVFVVASLNLAVGYALGAGWSPGMLLDLLPARKKRAASEASDEPELTRPAAKAAAPQAVAPRAKPAAGASKPVPAEVLASLASFREKLTTANVDLKLTKTDPTQFVENAAKLQEANHEYLEEAQGAIRHLEQLGAAGDAIASATCAAVSQGASQVAAISTEIDGLIEAGLEDDAARSELIAHSDRARDAVKQAEQNAKTAIAEVRTTPAETPPSSFADIDAMFDRLEALLEAADDQTVRHVAAVRVDPLSEADGDEALVASVERAVGKIARSMLEESQLLAPGPPAMLLLEGDDFQSATERIERLRQQVEATVFELDGRELRATVTCALVDTRHGDARDQVIDQINQALEESNRQGSNRTFHHDGAFPTPAPEVAVKVKPQTVALR